MVQEGSSRIHLNIALKEWGKWMAGCFLGGEEAREVAAIVTYYQPRSDGEEQGYCAWWSPRLSFSPGLGRWLFPSLRPGDDDYDQRKSQWSDFKHTEEKDCCNGWVMSDKRKLWMSSTFLTWTTRTRNGSCFPEMMTFVLIGCFSGKGSAEHLIWDAWHAVGYESKAEGTVPLKTNI